MLRAVPWTRLPRTLSVSVSTATLVPVVKIAPKIISAIPRFLAAAASLATATTTPIYVDLETAILTGVAVYSVCTIPMGGIVRFVKQDSMETPLNKIVRIAVATSWGQTEMLDPVITEPDSVLVYHTLLANFAILAKRITGGLPVDKAATLASATRLEAFLTGLYIIFCLKRMP